MEHLIGKEGGTQTHNTLVDGSAMRLVLVHSTRPPFVVANSYKYYDVLLFSLFPKYKY